MAARRAVSFMARRKKPAAPENHERWLVSYADFITLLFAFFVVMFASAQNDKSRDKAQQISDSVKKAFEQSRVAAVLGGTVDDRGKGNAQMKGAGGGQKELERIIKEAKENPHAAALAGSMETLTTALSTEIAQGQIHVTMEKRGLVVSFSQAALFASGGDDISEDSVAALEKVASAIKKLPNPIRLEGHTDSKPIRTARFHSNWELSAARSIATLELLSTRFGVRRDRMSIGGYADVAPIETNDTAEGRARNRRVDIVILNETGQAAEPVAAH